MTTYLLALAMLLFSLFVTFFVLYLKNYNEFKKIKKLRDDFTAMMIHELRSPLSIVRSSANLLVKQAPNLTTVQITDLLSQIENSAEDLLAIVNDLLDVAKIEDGKLTIYKQQVDLKDLLEAELNSFRPMGLEKHLKLTFEPNGYSGVVYCDKDKIKRVLNNLLSNAIKFTDTGEIKLILEKKAGYVLICVSDTGPGIPNELKGKVFEKFVQLRNLPVSREKGTGLGLAIAKGIVEAHGGKIWVENHAGERGVSLSGSEFKFTLPFK